MQLEKDENQSTECNGGNGEGYMEPLAKSFDRGTLHLPAFERLMQVMNRLDGPDASTGGVCAILWCSAAPRRLRATLRSLLRDMLYIGPPPQRQTDRSPLSDPKPAESPQNFSRRHHVSHPDSDSHGVPMRLSPGISCSPAKNQPVSSHPIDGFESSPSQSSDARGPVPEIHHDRVSDAGMRRLDPNQHSSMYTFRLDDRLPARSGLGTEACKQDPDRSATPGAMANMQRVPEAGEQVVLSMPGTDQTQESPPAKSRRRSPPALSSLSLVEPTAQPSSTLTSPDTHGTELADRGSGIMQQFGTSEQVMATQDAAQQPSQVHELTCLQRAEIDTRSITHAHEQRHGAESGAVLSFGHQGVDATLKDNSDAVPCNVVDVVRSAVSGDPVPSVVPEDSRGSSFSQKEELLQFLGNLSEKYELDVDVKAISPNVCFVDI